MSKTVSDSDLIKCTTHTLKKMLDQGAISMNEHSELRKQRRRLQNRKYARKCAKKKMEEILKLSEGIKQENDEMQSLRDQLEKVTLSRNYVARQLSIINKVLDDKSGSDEQKVLRVLNEQGSQIGTALLMSQRSSPSPTPNSSLNVTSNGSNILPQSCSHAMGPVISGRSNSTHASVVSHDRVLVRPAGGGFAASGRGLSDY